MKTVGSGKSSASAVRIGLDRTADDGVPVILSKASGSQCSNKNDLLHHALHLVPSLRPHPPIVAIAAGHLGKIPDVHWMLEWNSFFVLDQRHAALQLSQHRVAGIAVLRDHLAI